MNVFKRVTFFSLVLTSAISAERLDQTALAMYGSAVNAAGQLVENAQPMCELAKEKVTEAVNAVIASDVFAKVIFIAQDRKAEVVGAWIGACVAQKICENERYRQHKEEVTLKDKVTDGIVIVGYGMLYSFCASAFKDMDLIFSGGDAHYAEELRDAYGQFLEGIGSGLKNITVCAVEEINKHPKAALAGTVAGALVYKVVTDARAKNNSKNVYNQYPHCAVSC